MACRSVPHPASCSAARRPAALTAAASLSGRPPHPLRGGASPLPDRTTPRRQAPPGAADLATGSSSPMLGSLDEGRPAFTGLHHVGLLVKTLERSLDFYCGVLGLTLNPARPDAKLPYRGAWLMVGPDMIHLMELPSPDPTDGRPEHGGKDRHACVGVADAAALGARLEAAGVAYTKSASGRAAIFFRDPDGNVLECAEHGEWR